MQDDKYRRTRGEQSRHPLKARKVPCYVHMALTGTFVTAFRITCQNNDLYLALIKKSLGFEKIVQQCVGGVYLPNLPSTAKLIPISPSRIETTTRNGQK